MSEQTLKITGGCQLSGTVDISGAKNSALPLLFATVLSSGKCVLDNVPALEDIDKTLQLLGDIGAVCSFQNGRVETELREVNCSEAPYSLVKAMRASFWVLGPLLARCGRASVALPGGDAIGTRPVDIHLDGLRQLGAEVETEHGVVNATAPRGLHGGTIKLAFPSVGATHHLLLTAALIDDDVEIHGAAREPEVVELAEFLIRMGAKISGAGTSNIRIHGATSLHGAEIRVIGDRIEAATYLAAAAITGGKVTIRNIEVESIASTIEVLSAAGCSCITSPSTIVIRAPKRLSSVNFSTAPYPGLATDVQPILMAMMTKARGTAEIEENIFENRFGHVAEFRRFGADISVCGHRATVKGVNRLSAAPVPGLDIRAAAAMVIMGLAAEGETVVDDIFHLHRGYDSMIAKLRSLGANIHLSNRKSRYELVVGC